MLYCQMLQPATRASQVQVRIVLHCCADGTTVAKAAVHAIAWSALKLFPLGLVYVMQAMRLEARSIQFRRKPDKLFPDGAPLLWAPAAVWEALEKQRMLVSVADISAQPPLVTVPQDQHPRVSWVFVPSFNRYHAKPDKQMLLDWADAMPAEHAYLRFIVIRPLPAEQQVIVTSWQYHDHEALLSILK